MSNFKYYTLHFLDVILSLISFFIIMYLINLSADYLLFFILYIISTFGKLILNVLYDERIKRNYRKGKYNEKR